MHYFRVGGFSLSILISEEYPSPSSGISAVEILTCPPGLARLDLGRSNARLPCYPGPLLESVGAAMHGNALVCDTVRVTAGDHGV